MLVQGSWLHMRVASTISVNSNKRFDPPRSVASPSVNRAWPRPGHTSVLSRLGEVSSALQAC